VQGELARVKDISFTNVETVKKIRFIGFSWSLLRRHNRFLGDPVRRLALSALLKPFGPVNRTSG
jgi:hypothetical protein